MSSPVQIIAGMAQDSAFAAARVLPMVDQVKPFPAVAEATKKECSSTATESRAGTTKRKADAPITEHGKKLKPDESPLPLQQKMSAIELSLLHGTQLAAHSSDNTPAYNLDMLTCDQISIPSLEGLDTSGLVPLPQGQSDIQPRDEDVLFVSMIIQKGSAWHRHKHVLTSLRLLVRVAAAKQITTRVTKGSESSWSIIAIRTATRRRLTNQRSANLS